VDALHQENVNFTDVVSFGSAKAKEVLQIISGDKDQ